MRNLVRDRRGAIAFMTVIALVPLIGFIALGAEAGSWYVTRQHAQNAADAAAYSGGLTVACALSGSTACDTADYVVRGEQFAARNGFCNTGATYTGCSETLVQTVEIDRGTYAGGVFTVSGTGDSVRAIVRQETSPVLATILGLTTFNIGALAVVTVQTKKDVCALGLGPQTNGITIGGSSEITGNGCAMMSDTALKFNSEPSFTGSNWAVQSVNGCSGGHCDVDVPYNYSALPARNPLSVLDTKSYNLRTGNTPPSCPVQEDGYKHCSPNSSGTGAYGKLQVKNGDKYFLDPGTYFFNADITVSEGGELQGVGVTLVLLGNSSIKITGGTVNLSAPLVNTFDSDLNGVLIDDQALTQPSNNVTINGASVSLGGVMYFPNVEVTWSGNTQNANLACTQVIANAITIQGDSYLSSAGCAAGTVPKTQVVALVE
jgi:hypothetical protein